MLDLGRGRTIQVIAALPSAKFEATVNIQCVSSNNSLYTTVALKTAPMDPCFGKMDMVGNNGISKKNTEKSHDILEHLAYPTN